MTNHIIHVTVIAKPQPLLQIIFLEREFGITDADLLKAQISPPGFYRGGELRVVDAVGLRHRLSLARIIPA